MPKTFYKKGVGFAISKGIIYCLEPVFLDIETSNNHAEKPEDLRTWITSIQVLFNDKYYLFRYPEELIEFYENLYNELDLYPDSMPYKLISFIHNSSFDLSYLIPYLCKLPDFDKGNSGIIRSVNKFLTFVRGSLEFRCSYLLSGMSLEKWSKEMNIEHKKAIGLYDYEKIIYPDDELTENEKTYDYIDVVALKECLQRQMLLYGNDSLLTLPLTSTGYIRRDLRRSCINDKYYRERYFINNRLNPDLYEYCLKSYAGGYTHNNRFYRDIVVQCGKEYEYNGERIRVDLIKHGDFKSHYPSQMTCYQLPLGQPHLIYKHSWGFSISIKRILSWSPVYSTVSVIRFYSAVLRDKSISMPFLQYSKCYDEHFDFKMLDNGRITAGKGVWVMYLDNYTLDILNEQYALKYEVLEVYRMRNKPLPKCIINIVDKYFKGKSDKKNLVHELTKQFGKLDERTINAEFELTQMKKLLNGSYGCLAMNPLQDNIAVSENLEFKYITSYKNHDKVITGLKEFYSKRNNFLAYQVGVFITALARYELAQYIGVFDRRGIKGIGYKYCLYCDTDSIFYISNEETEKAIKDLNALKRQTAHTVTLENGKIENYDEFTFEPDIKAFKGLHAKCYGIVTNKGLELTIAGIPARTLVDMKDGQPVYITRESELQGKEKDPIKALNKLKDGFEFHINAGVSAIYIGATGFKTPHEITIQEINGHEIHTAGGCVIRKLKSKKVKDVEIDDDETYDENIINNFDIESLN